MLGIGPFEPDKQNYQGGTSQLTLGCVPRGDGVGPWKAFSVYTASLPSACRGEFYARKTDGSVVVFAGTSNMLWRLDATTLTWTPVSKVNAVTSITNASPAVVNYTTHPFAIGDKVVFTTTSALPTGLVVGTVYFVITAGFGANAFQVSLTSGGAAVNTSSAGSGTHSVTIPYTALTTTSHWQFEQFNNSVIAVQGNVNPQTFDISSSTVFADLGGSPPQASYIAIVNRFVVLTGLTGNPFRIQWSGLNAITTWNGTASSDFQDFPDGGVARGVAGGEYGVVFQDSTIRSMTFAVGSTYVFAFVRIAQDKGLLAPYSIVRAGSNVFFLASQGFHVIAGPASPPVAIGKEKVDRYFFTNYDQGSPQLIIGASDPQQSRVYWAWKSQAGAVGLFDQIIMFDYAPEMLRWGLVPQVGEFLSSLASPGITLEGLDTISSSIDALTFSLDDVALSALPKIVCANSSHQLGFFSGTNIEATFDTGEQRITGKRGRIQGMYAVTDAPTFYGSVGYRENIQAAVQYSPEQLITSQGICWADWSTPLARFHGRIPAGTVWTYASGFDPMFVEDGTT